MSMKWDKIYEGNDLAEALRLAARGSGIAEPELDYTIVEQGRRGLFGLGSKNVRIKLKPPLDAGSSNAAAPARKSRPPRKRSGSERKRSESSQESQGSEKKPQDDAGNRQGLGDTLRGSGDSRRGPGGKRRGRRGKAQAPGQARGEARGEGQEQGQGQEKGQGQANKRQGSGNRRPRSGEKRQGSGNRRARKPRPLMEAAPEDLAKVEETVRRLLELMNLELELRIEVEPTGLFIGLEGADEKRLTADNGELMASIQFLLNRMARRGWPSVARISLAHDHRDHARDEELIELVREVAQQVESTGDAKRLHEMNAYERRLVHVTIRQTEGLGSRSEGNGSLKRVKIYKQEAGDQ